MQNELFKLTPLELIEAKLYTLQRIRKNEHKIIELKDELLEKEANILLKTDFKALGYTNEKMQTAYLNQELKDDKKEIEELKHVLTKQGDDIRLIDDLLELYRVKALTGADTIK